MFVLNSQTFNTPNLMVFTGVKNAYFHKLYMLLGTYSILQNSPITTLTIIKNLSTVQFLRKEALFKMAQF